MRFVIQRVTHASVTVEGEIKGRIDKGFMVLIGVSKTDTRAEADRLITVLMGDEVKERKKYIFEHANFNREDKFVKIKRT